MDETQKTKVLYIITKSNWGGAGRYVYDLATQLPKENYLPTVACGGQGSLAEKLTAAGVEVRTLTGLERDVRITKEIHAFISIFNVIKEVRPDIVHLNSSKAGALGALAARLYNATASLSRPSHTRAKIIFTAHGWPFKEKRRVFVRKIIEYISWVTVVLSDTTIVVSEDDRKKAKKFLWVQPKIVTIHNGIHVPPFKSKEEARAALIEKIPYLPAKEMWIGSIAELHKNKGLAYSIRAIAELVRNPTAGQTVPTLAYLIVGAGEEKTSLEQLIIEEKMQDTVALIGEYPEAATLLKAFDIFLVPSLKEGLPYVLLEAGAAALPVIASDVGGVSEVIEDMTSGVIVRPKRPKEITEALRFLLEHPDKKAVLANNLSHAIKSTYTLERMVDETTKLY